MTFYDIHCHLEICNDIEGAVKRAKEKKVVFVTQGVNRETNRKALEFVEKYKEYGNVECALGIYPGEGLKMSEKEIDDEIKFIKKNGKKIKSIGEVGMDFKESVDLEERKRQEEIFVKMIKLSIDLDLPIQVHSRKAEKECIEILEKSGIKKEKVIMHCFCGKASLVKRIIDNGWFITVPTNVISSQQFQDIAKNAPISQILCETDSPFLHPFKERYNEPGNVIESYKKIAEIKGIKLEEVEREIEKNVKRLVNCWN